MKFPKLLNFNLLNLIVILIAMNSCNTDELCYDHPHDGQFYIRFDWSAAPDANPTGMRVWFYSQADADPYFVDTNADKDSVEVREFNYHILAHNNDTEWITFVGTHSYQSHTLTTRDGGLLEPLGAAYRGAGLRADNDDDRIAVAPEPVWAVGRENIQVTHGDTLVLAPQPMHCHYTYEFRNVGSLKHVAHVSAAISGMADGVNISTGRLSGTTCTIPLEAVYGGDSHSIVGSFYTFGHNPDVALPHRMALYVVMDDGKQYKYVSGDYLDVTAQVHNAPDPREVHIVVEGLQIPTAIENGSGFAVDLTAWDEVNHEIVM